MSDTLSIPPSCCYVIIDNIQKTVQEHDFGCLPKAEQAGHIAALKALFPETSTCLHMVVAKDAE